MSKIAVLIPCYNEGLTVGKVIRDFQHELPDADIYVYDNNSTDKTAEEAEKNGAIVRSEARQGKGNVIRSMFREIDADVYVMADGDDTNCPFGVKGETVSASDMVNEVLENRIDMVIGKRKEYFAKTGSKKKLNGAGNMLITKLINWFFKSDINDILTGYRAFSRKFVKTFPVISRGFEIETELTTHAIFHSLKYKELETTYRERPSGSESKLHAVKDGFRVLWMIGRLIREYRPLGFFSVCAFILSAIGIVLGSIPVIEYFETGLVLRMPTLIISVLFILAAFIIAQAGLIMHLIVKKAKQQFEYAYYSIREKL